MQFSLAMTQCVCVWFRKGNRTAGITVNNDVEFLVLVWQLIRALTIGRKYLIHIVYNNLAYDNGFFYIIHANTNTCILLSEVSIGYICWQSIQFLRIACKILINWCDWAKHIYYCYPPCATHFRQNEMDDVVDEYMYI